MTGSGIFVGVDVGGTFTDFTLIEQRAGEGQAKVAYHKVPSTPDAPAKAIVQGISELAECHCFAPGDIEYLGHGTTVGTNALIQRRGGPAGLLTTSGFRDVLEIARQTRPHLYDYSHRRAAPLVPRRWRLEVSERIRSDGSVLRPLNTEEVAEAGAIFERAGVRAVAISFLHAYRNPVHEREAAAILREVLPSEVSVSLSSDVWPAFREYERTSTTVANAFLQPQMAGYLDDLLVRLASIGVAVAPFTFHSNGGLMSPGEVAQLPVRTCLSGPAAGVMGAAHVANACASENVITFDVGGTSTDVSMVAHGKPSFSLERAVAGYAVKSPTLDVHVIGAGGGSIAWQDEGGVLRVGPESAGASPGPIAYGLGGTKPTLTDANVALARLSPGGLLGGGLPLDEQSASEAMEVLAGELGCSSEEGALGVIRVACANIARAIRAVSTERGFEIDDFALMAFGGAGPVLAAEVAREVRCRRVIVPVAPGTLCARGILASDRSTDYVRTVAALADGDGWGAAQALFRDMLGHAETWFETHAIPQASRGARLSADMRYVGQGFEVPVSLELDQPLEDMVQAFHQAHEDQYGYALPGRGAEIINVRVQAVGKLGREVRGFSARPAIPPTRRPVFFGAEGWVDTPVCQRETLSVGTCLNGPVVVEELSSTTVVLPGDTVRVDVNGNLIMEIDLT